MTLRRHSTSSAFLVVFPYRLTLPSTYCVSYASHFLVVCLPSECCSYPPPTINVYSTFVLPTPFFTRPQSYSTPFYSTPCYPTRVVLLTPYPTLGTTPCTHQPCHTPNPSHPLPLLLSLSSAIIHVPIWCRGRSRSIGPRAACSLNGIPSGSCWAYATTRGLGCPQHPPPGGTIAGQTRFPNPCWSWRQCWFCSP